MTLNLAPSSISQTTCFQNLPEATHSHLDHLIRGLRLLSTACIMAVVLLELGVAEFFSGLGDETALENWQLLKT